MNPLARKLHLKSGQRVRVLNPPAGFELDLPGEATRVDAGPADAALLFASTRVELAVLLPEAVATLPEDGLLWAAFPKKTSGWQTDLAQMRGWEPLGPFGLRIVTLVAVDGTWTAARLRPIAHMKSRVSTG